MSKLTKDEFIKSLKEMSIKEVMELVDAMKEEFGIDPTAVAVASGAAAGAESAEEKTEFTVTLVGVGQSKVQVIKVVKAATGLGLMDAKKLTDTTPIAVKENISKDEADELAKLLKDAGADVKID
jgi:large subunit ribosomal protein L7/L12